MVLKAQGHPLQGSNVRGVAYAFAYPIKAGFTYNVSSNLFRVKNAGGTTTASVNFQVGTTTSLPNPNSAGTDPTACLMVGYNQLTALLPFQRGSVGINNSSPQNYNIVQNYTPTINQSFFTVLAFGDGNPDVINLNIKTITVTEQHPFSIIPAALNITCGNTTTRTFTVNNATNAPGTITYNWNLGSANNGWLYNNSPAPQTFTTSTNSITLTPQASATALSNVSVTVVLNGTTITTLNSAVTVTPPVFTVIGPTEICSTGSYGLSNLTPGATVSWIFDPSIISMTSSGVATVIGSGNTFISATVTLPNSCSYQVIPKAIIAGTAPPAGISFENQDPLCINERYPRGVKVTSVVNPVPGAGYEWRVNNILRGSDETVINIINSWCNIGTNTVSVRAFLCNSWSTPITATFEAQYCEEGLRAISVFPNPSIGLLQIKLNENKPFYEIRVKDKSGSMKFVKRFAIGVNNTQIDISQLPPDIYILEVYDGKKWIFSKVIKK
ncbi:MAG: T9SS type A sorting domain-containing protein [Chitinophagaceae bacterium]|nr:T9SS type A sorting domain-containing protein [Chitinophagaceae bacterium]